jgi:hypothetical protein
MKKFDDFSKYNSTELISVLAKAASNGDADLVKHILINFKSDINAVTHAFYNACNSNHLNLVKYLLYSDELKQNADISSVNQISFITACQGGLETVKFLMPLLDYNPEVIKRSISRACMSGKLEIIKYLISEREKKEGSNFDEDLNEWLKFAGMKGNIKNFEYLLSLGINKDIVLNDDNNLFDEIIESCYSNDKFEMIKYLLGHKEIKGYINIHKDNDSLFKYFCEGHNDEIIKFLIIDLHIEKTKEIEKFLIENPNKHVKNLFEKRDIKIDLDKELISLNINKKRKNKV